MKIQFHPRKFSFAIVAFALSADSLGLVAACTDDSAIHENVPVDSGRTTSDGSTTQPDGGTIIIGPDSSIVYDCFAGDAQTYDQIINACTSSTKIDKHPTLPLLLADGGLPPLP